MRCLRPSSSPKTGTTILTTHSTIHLTLTPSYIVVAALYGRRLCVFPHSPTPPAIQSVHPCPLLRFSPLAASHGNRSATGHPCPGLRSTLPEHHGSRAWAGSSLAYEVASPAFPRLLSLLPIARPCPAPAGSGSPGTRWRLSARCATLSAP